MANDNNTLIITNVDLDLLEEQRLALEQIEFGETTLLNSEQTEALSGIINMLNEWSKERMEEKVSYKESRHVQD